MAIIREYREDLQRDWEDEPLTPGTPKEEALIAKFEFYLLYNVPNIQDAHKHARELWRIVRQNP